MHTTHSTGGLGNTGSQTPRNRSWCFTLNNYNDDDEESIQNIECKYLIYGREVGEKGTPHLQGTIQFNHAKTFSAVKKNLTKAHLEPCIDLLASIKYCKKDGDIFEKGVPPSDGGGEGKIPMERSA